MLAAITRANPGGSRTAGLPGNKQGYFDYERRVCELELQATQLRVENDRLRRELAQSGSVLKARTTRIEKSPAALVILDASGNLVEANEAAREILGIRTREVFQGPFSGFLSGENIRTFLTHLRDCGIKRKPCEARLEISLPDGSARPVRLTTQRWRFGPRDPWHYQMLISDAGVRCEMEAEPHRHAAATRDFIDSLEGIIWEVDLSTGRRTLVSGQSERLLGYAVADWMADGAFWANRIPAEDRERVLNLARQAVETRKNYVCEYRMIAADRRIVWLRELANVIEENGLLKLRGISVDITDRKRREVELERMRAALEKHVAERTDELANMVGEMESFSYTLSHDMRAPLRAMHGYADLLLESGCGGMNAEQREYLERIRAATERFDQMICDVLNYARRTAGPTDLASTDLEEMVRRVLEETPEFQASAAHIEIERPLLCVMGHKGFLAQCLSHLLSNAVKFVAPGTVPHVRIRTEPVESEVRLWIEDNGTGISLADQRRIFRIFQSDSLTPRLSTGGIGLEIVQRAVRRMKGRAGAESVPGKGSRFWLQLGRG